MWKPARSNGGVDVALCSYACNFQVFGLPDNNVEPSIWSWLKTHGATKLTQISDGTSNTVFVAEKRKVCGPGNPSPDWSGNTYGTAWGHPANDRWWPVFARINLAGTEDRNNPNFYRYNVPQVNPKPADCQWWDHRPQGHSPAGTICGMGDGSVRMIRGSIDVDTWSRYVLPRDGQVISDNY